MALHCSIIGGGGAAYLLLDGLVGGDRRGGGPYDLHDVNQKKCGSICDWIFLIFF
jgi:hypothetical protein